MDYIAIIHKEPDSDFGVSFRHFPGCITVGRTLDEAKHMALVALIGHIEVIRETGESAPEPSSVDEVMSYPEFQDGMAVLVNKRDQYLWPSCRQANSSSTDTLPVRSRSSLMSAISPTSCCAR